MDDGYWNHPHNVMGSSQQVRDVTSKIASVVSKIFEKWDHDFSGDSYWIPCGINVAMRHRLGSLGEKHERSTLMAMETMHRSDGRFIDEINGWLAVMCRWFSLLDMGVLHCQFALHGPVWILPPLAKWCRLDKSVWGRKDPWLLFHVLCWLINISIHTGICYCTNADNFRFCSHYPFLLTQ
jgi:hypothetical protein